MSLNYLQQINNPNLYQVLQSTKNNIMYGLNCCRIGIVEEFFEDNLTVKVKIANKQTISLNQDGTQNVKEFPPIYAKVLYNGWKDTRIEYPIEVGTEGILLFCDREIESWFINGDINPLAYERNHEYTDALFIAGLHSIPNMVEFVQDCLNFVYKNTSMQMRDNAININSGNITIDGTTLTVNADSVTINATTTTINGNLVVNGNVNVDGNINATGIITGDTDVVGGGISVKGHTHISSAPGSPTSTPS